MEVQKPAMLAGGADRERRVASRVYCGRIEAVLRQIPVILAGNLVSASLLAVMLWGIEQHNQLSIWVISVIVVAAARYIFWRRAEEHPVEPANVDRMAAYLTIGSAASGIIWGIGVFAFFPIEHPVLQGFVYLLMAGMTAGSFATYSSHPPAFIAFSGTSILLLAARLIAEGGTAYTGMGLLAIFYLVAVTITVRNIFRVISDTLTLRMEKEELIGDLEEARNEAEEASQAKSNFLAMVSHELRTPLNAVLGFAQVLRDETLGPLGHTKYKDYAMHIYTSGDHLLQLINELLDVSRAEKSAIDLDSTLIDPEQIIDNCIAVLEPRAEQQGVSLRTQFVGEIPLLVADGRRVRQVLLNIVGNAIKFSEKGSEVKIVTEQPGEGDLVIKVIDRGIGMDPEELPTALRFFGQIENALSRRHEGAGIGLPLSKILMELHGGALEIESRKGAGTTVTLIFPASRLREAPASSILAAS